MEFVRCGAFSLTWPAATQTGHSRGPETLTFKARPSTIPFSWKWVLFEWEWIIISISKTEHLTSFWYRGPRGTQKWHIGLEHQYGRRFIVWDTNMATVTLCEKALFQILSLNMKPHGVTIQMRATEQYFHLILSVFQHFAKWNLNILSHFDLATFGSEKVTP